MKADVRQHNGTPTLFLNDKPEFADIPWIGYLDPNGLEANLAAIRAFAGAGVHIFSTDALNHEWCGPRPHDPSPTDFTTMGPRLQTAIDADPEALFVLRIMFETRWLCYTGTEAALATLPDKD